jgi:phosphoribosyl 1,2-cyclic phosphate phosphodiesterase
MSNDNYIKILGCGSSLGVPVLCCKCKVCTSELLHNKRGRSSIYISVNNTTLLVDFGFDIKSQLLREKISNLDYAILTHNHADHISGIDELRVFPFAKKKPLQIITDTKTADSMEIKYSYLFKNDSLQTWKVGFFDKIELENITVQFFKQYHGNVDSLGLRIGNFVYSTDVSGFYKESEKFLYYIENWVLDCCDYNSLPNHIGLDNVLKLNTKYQPKRIWLTNMGHNIDYYDLQKSLPENIKPLHDGFILKQNSLHGI